MLMEAHTPVWLLLGECQRLAEQLFRKPVRVRFELLPSLDGDSFRADVRSAQEPAAAAPTLLVAPPARGKLAALRQLLAALRDTACGSSG
jgi:hypothetical protein